MTPTNSQQKTTGMFWIKYSLSWTALNHCLSTIASIIVVLDIANIPFYWPIKENNKNLFVEFCKI